MWSRIYPYDITLQSKSHSLLNMKVRCFQFNKQKVLYCYIKCMILALIKKGEEAKGGEGGKEEGKKEKNKKQNETKWSKLNID